MTRKYQYEFTLEICTIKLQQDPRGLVQISWANTILTRKSYKIDQIGVWQDIGQKLGMKSFCKLEGMRFSSKVFDVKVLIVNKGGHNEIFGEFPIDVCSILNPQQPARDVSRANEVYLNNGLGKVNYTLSAKLIKESSPFSLDTTTTQFTTPRPFSRHSQTSAEFSFQIPNNGREGRDSIHEKDAKISNDPSTFLQQLEMKRNLDKQKQKVTEVEKELGRASEKIKILEGEKQQKSVNLMNQVNMLSNENSNLRNRLQEFNNRFAQTREDQAKIEEKTRRIQQLQAENLRKYNQYIAVENRNSVKIMEISSFNERIHQQNVILTAQLQKASDRIRQLQSIREQQSIDISNEKITFEKKMKGLEDRCREKEFGLEKVRLQYENSNMERTNILMKQKEYKSKLDIQETVIKRLQTQNMQMKSMARQLESQYNEYKVKNQGKQRQFEARISDLEAILSKKQIDLRERNEVIDKAKLFIQKKDEQINQRNNFIMQAKQYLGSKQAEIKQVIEEGEKFKSELREKERYTLRLKQETVSLNERLRVSLEESRTLREQIQVKEKYLSEYLSDLAAETEKTVELERQIQYLREQLTEEQEQSSAKEEQLKSSLSDLIKQNVEYKLQMAKAQNQLKRMQEKIIAGH